MKIQQPLVGVGVIIQNKAGKILLGLRHKKPQYKVIAIEGKNTWCLPGGKLDFKETLEDAAIREVKEECDLNISDLKIIAINNEIDENFHFITICFLAQKFTGKIKVQESDKMVKWEWFDLNNLPENLYLPSKNALNNFMKKKIYIK